MPTLSVVELELELASPLVSAWTSVLGDDQCRAILSPAQTHSVCERCGISETELARQLLPMAASYAVAPISDFYVGAIVVDSNDGLYMGANYERRGVPLSHSLHAEQSALFNAISHGCADITQLVVTAAPCGHCRQFIRELGAHDTLNIHFGGQRFTLNELLPHNFGPEDLGVCASLKGERSQPSDNCAYASASYAPYSHAKSAVLGKANDKVLAQGWYIENAAFNPSASPLALMLSQLHLQGLEVSQLDTIELVMQANDSISYEADVALFCQQHAAIRFQITYI
jgi:cytidine deaminase